MKTRYEDKLAEPRPYLLVTGMKIADSYAALLQEGPGDTGLHVGEAMMTVNDKHVATNTDADGSIHQRFDRQNKLVVTDCEGWTTDSERVLARVGVNSKPAEATATTRGSRTRAG